jgi:ornithine cyclodeaminase/alanine dehydrogenase-like protein (mu-crystallin family)
LFPWEHAQPGLFIAAVGSATPAMHELPAEAFLASEVWLDSRQALRESGDCRAALAAGWSESAVAGDLFDLLGPDAAAPVRRTPDGTRPILFKSTGHAVQDLALLAALWDVYVKEPHPGARPP